MKHPNNIYFGKELKKLVRIPIEGEFILMYGDAKTPIVIVIRGKSAKINPNTLPDETMHDGKWLILKPNRILVGRVTIGKYHEKDMSIEYSLTSNQAWEYWYKLNEEIG